MINKIKLGSPLGNISISAVKLGYSFRNYVWDSRNSIMDHIISSDLTSVRDSVADNVLEPVFDCIYDSVRDSIYWKIISDRYEL